MIPQSLAFNLLINIKWESALWYLILFHSKKQAVALDIMSNEKMELKGDYYHGNKMQQKI